MDSMNVGKDVMINSQHYFNENNNIVSMELNDRCENKNDNSNLSNNSNHNELLPKNCYCGEDRNLNMPEFQCVKCLKWFHHRCLAYNIYPSIPFLTTYIFYCKLCSSTKMESFKRTPTNFSQICQTTIANLLQKHSAEGRIAFSKDKEIIPFIETNWAVLANKPRPLKNTWHSSVVKIMQKDNDNFMCDNRDNDNLLFALRLRDLTKIAPHYENLKNIKEQNGGPNSSANIGSRSVRGMKKRLDNNEAAYSNKRQKSELYVPKLPANGFPAEFPFNKDNFRYILAEPDDNAPFRKEFDETQEYCGKQIPSWICRKLMPDHVLLSMNDRSHYLKISDDRKTVIGEKGYSSIRASHGVSRGTWYYEIKINEVPPKGATRIGWAQELASLLCPIGYDKFGYSWRSRKGTAFHESIGKHYADEGFGAGDVLGCLIDLPNVSEPSNEYSLLPKCYKECPLIKFKSFLYFEEKDEPVKKEVEKLRPLEGARIAFYKNGVKIGIAFENIYRGTYYPSAGLYKNISITFNFGPNFTFPPTDDEFANKYRPMSDVVFDAKIEQTLSDIIYLVANENELTLEKFYN